MISASRLALCNRSPIMDCAGAVNVQCLVILAGKTNVRVELLKAKEDAVRTNPASFKCKVLSFKLWMKSI